MKKVVEKMKIIITVLFVILVSFVAFWGVFQKENGVWKNVVPDYNYGMDLKGARELVFALDTKEEEKYVYVDEDGNIKGEVWKDGSATTEDAEKEKDSDEENVEETESQTESEEEKTEDSDNKEDEEEVPYAKETRNVKVNSDETLTKENFEKAKSIIQKRLKLQELGEYTIRIDDVTGKVVIENANDEDDVDLIEDMVSNPGKFKIVDYQNGVILMDNSDIKNVSVVYSNEDSTYKTYLQIEFNKDGSEKLREISNKYVEKTVEAEEETEESSDKTSNEKNSEENTDEDTTEETEKKCVSVVFDEKTLMTTYFGEEMTNGMIQIAVGEERTEYKDFLKDHKDAKVIADTLNTGVLPVTYSLETDNFVKSEITKNDLKNIVTGIAIVLVILFIIDILKYKKYGLISTILNIGFISVLSLVCRYTNVEITVNSIVASFLVILMNYVFVSCYLKELKKTGKSVQAYSKVSKIFYLSIVPVMIVAIVFTLMPSYITSSMGMIIFWGVILNIIYNLIFTKTVIKRED